MSGRGNESDLVPAMAGYGRARSPSFNVQRSIRPLSEKRQKVRANGPIRANSVRGIHRGYRFLRRSPNRYAFDHILWRMFPALPKTFEWNSDLGTAKHYIDAIYASDKRTTLRYEKEGTAVDVQFVPTSDAPTSTYSRVSVTRLLEALALKDAFDAPLWDNVAFVTDGSYLVPCDYIASLITADPKLFGHLDPRREWVRARPEHLQKMGLQTGQVTSGMYLNASAKMSPAGVAAAVARPEPVAEGGPSDDLDAEAPPQGPPRERTLSRRDRVDYVEWVTEVQYDGQAPYYCRRLYRDQQMLYEATSFHRQGPWTVYHRDNNLLLALGVDP
jgi:hypothetical protein